MEKDFSVLKMLLISSATLLVFMVLILISPMAAVWCLIGWFIYTAINLLYFSYKFWRDSKQQK